MQDKEKRQKIGARNWKYSISLRKCNQNGGKYERCFRPLLTWFPKDISDGFVVRPFSLRKKNCKALKIVSHHWHSKHNNTNSEIIKAIEIEKKNKRSNWK